MATKILTDADIEQLDRKQIALTDADIAKLDSGKAPVLTDADMERLDKGMSLAQRVFTPISKQITGKSLTERAGIVDKAKKSMVDQAVSQGRNISPAEAVIRGAPAVLAESAVELIDLTPFDVALGGVVKGAGKLSSKIPIRGTTLGRILSKVPVGKGFTQGVNELGRLDQALKPFAGQIGAPKITTLSPVEKIINALKQAQPVRALQEEMYSLERSKRAKAITSIGQKVSGERGYFTQLKALKGELPKAEFEGIRKQVSQADVDSLFNDVEKSILSPYEKITAKTGLTKLLGVEGGSVPTKGEISLLSEIFPSEFIDTVLSKRSVLTKFGEQLSEIINIPRSIMASFDMSAPLRQGVFLVGRPKQFIPAFGNMFKYFFNEKSYQGLLDNIKARPTYQLMRRGNLPLTEIGARLAKREEEFISRLPEKIPLVGNVIRASNRAYSGFLNKLRADTFDDLISKANLQGVKLTDKVVDDIASFVGSATGRGKLPGSLERAAVALNQVLFSPRLIASRLNLMNPAFYIGLNPFVRKEALKSLFTFAGTASTVLTLAYAGGAKVGTDPRSSDFGKIIIGNTRYDILGGFQQYMRLAGQLITGEYVSSTTGAVSLLGEGYKPLTRLDILNRFGETKLNPAVSMAVSALRGKNYMGKDFNVGPEAIQRFIPLVVQDMYELHKERGLEGIGMSLPAIFGVGVQTYSPTPEEIVHSAKSVANYAKKLIKQGRAGEAREFYEENKHIVEMAVNFNDKQKEIDELEREVNSIEENVRIIPQRKEAVRAIAEKRIQQLQSEMEETLKQLKNQQGDNHAKTPE